MVRISTRATADGGTDFDGKRTEIKRESGEKESMEVSEVKIFRRILFTFME